MEGCRLHNVEPKRLMMETTTKVKQPMSTYRRRGFVLSNGAMCVCSGRWLLVVKQGPSREVFVQTELQGK